MTTVRSLATCTTDFPDESVWSEDEDTELRMSGESIATVVAQMLRNMGCEVEAPCEDPPYGWRIYATASGRSLLFQITDLREEVYLLCEDLSWLNKILGRTHPAFVGVVCKLNEALAEDGRFHDVLWHPRKGEAPDAPGWRSPVGPD